MFYEYFIVQMTQKALHCLFISTAFFLFSCSDEAAINEPCDVNAPFAKVTHYDYSFDLDNKSASSLVTFNFQEAGCCALLENKTELTDSPWVESEELIEIKSDGDELSFCFDDMQAPGTSFTFHSQQTVNESTLEDSQVGFSTQFVNSNHNLEYMLSWVEGCSVFGPCDPAPDAFATYNFHVTHQEDVTVLCPGQITNSPNLTNCDFNFDGGPTYSTFGIIAYSDWEEIPLESWDDVAITLFDNRSESKIEFFDTEYHRDFFRWMVEHFGPYPYGDELRFIFAPTYWNGFEHPGNIVLSDALNTGGLFSGSPYDCLLYTSPSPRDATLSRMPSSA